MIQGYPYETEDDCVSACKLFDEEQAACWPNFCERAKEKSTPAKHRCEHAWGALGLKECSRFSEN